MKNLIKRFFDYADKNKQFFKPQKPITSKGLNLTIGKCEKCGCPSMSKICGWCKNG